MKYRLLFCFFVLVLICTFNCNSCGNSVSTKNATNSYEIVYASESKNFWGTEYAELKTINLQTMEIKVLYKEKVPQDEDEEGFMRFYNASWSKDAKSILFNADHLEGTLFFETYLLKLGAKKPTFIVGYTGNAYWGKNNRILIEEHGSIYEYNIQIGDRKEIIKGVEYKGGVETENKPKDYGPSLLSKDGNTILCALRTDRVNIILYNLRTKQQLKVTEGEYMYLERTAWSPDEKKIIFSAWKEVTPPLQTPTLNIINIDGTGKRVIYEGKKGHEIERPVWSPNGKKIAFAETWTTGNVGHSNLLVLDVKTRKTKNLGGGGSPVWFPDSKRILYRGKLSIINISTGKKEDLPGAKATDLSPFAIKPINKDTAKIQRKQRGDKGIKGK